MRKSFFCRLLDALAPYHAIAGIFLILLVVMKVIEFFLLDIDASNRYVLLARALTYNLIVASWTVLVVGILFLLIRLLSRRVAVWFAVVFFSLLLLSEVGLLFYVLHNGFLLGCELLARPISESWMAVRGAVGVVLPIILPIFIIGGFLTLALWLAAHPSKVNMLVMFVVLLFAILSIVFKPSHLVSSRYFHFILNKSWYVVVDSYYYFGNQSHCGDYSDLVPAYDSALVAELLDTHPEWATPTDSLYPLERPFVADTFLNRFFYPSQTLPNIVLILVESLGHEMMGTGAMPFVDSLANTGLYWPNCLSTTMRSYGAMPALTGSVGGPKCFQFGTMPFHNSLISLLKHDGYNTRAYYGGDFTFDCIYEYLTAQHIDFLSPLYERFKSSPSSKQGYWWGYNDDTLFDYVIHDLNSQPKTLNPHLSLITTLTMHDDLKLPDASRQKYYQQQASKLPVPQAGKLLFSHYPSSLFTDDCLRKFVHEYEKRSDFQNTIFVIVGDHASGLQKGDILSQYHVPLILWSPLVKHPARFTHVVTHNDVSPALYSLLVSRYGLAPQPTVQWLGDGLGDSPKTLVMLNYAHEIHDIIYHNYFYKAASSFEDEELCTFGPDMLLQPCSDASALDNCRRQLKLMRYLYAYTYYCDRLTAHPIYSRNFVVSKTISFDKIIECIIPDNPPSVSGTVDWPLLPAQKLSAKRDNVAVRISLEADVTVHDSVYMNQFPTLHFSFDNGQYVKESDCLSKFLLGDASYHPGTYHLTLSKDFLLNPTHTNTLSITLSSPGADADCIPGAHFTFFNARITIAYSR